jgi:hypothetical protein
LIVLAVATQGFTYTVWNGVPLIGRPYHGAYRALP